MADLPRIATLWIGGRLTWLEQLCLVSFVDAGHEVTLYSYQDIPNVPRGVKTASAEEYFPSKPMYTHKKNGSPAIHADLWRINLLAKSDEVWVDADMYCYKPFDFKSQHVFGWEKPNLICNAVLGLPNDSDALGQMLEFFKDEYAIAPWLKPWQQEELQQSADAGNPVHMCEQAWGFTGPACVTYFLQKTGEAKFAQSQPTFYPISFKERNHMIRTYKKPEEQFTDDTTGVHFWARRMKPRLEEKENNRPRRASFMAKLLEKHDINPDDALIPPKKPIAA
ncbi:MAG: hypothetical protein ACPGRD_04485 [Planktomarina sp.]